MTRLPPRSARQDYDPHDARPRRYRARQGAMIIQCTVCGRAFAPAKRLRRKPLYCSHACAQRAYTQRQVTGTKIWGQRQPAREGALGPPGPGDKIAWAKKRSDDLRQERKRADRIAAGLPTRPRHGRKALGPPGDTGNRTLRTHDAPTNFSKKFFTGSPDPQGMKLDKLGTASALRSAAQHKICSRAWPTLAFAAELTPIPIAVSL